MEQYIKKSALVAEIERQKAQWRICKSSEAKYRREMLDDISSFIDTLEVKEYSEEYDGFLGKELKMVDDEIERLEKLKVKEVDLERIIFWFDHIAQIADDRMTLTNQRMTDAHALDEIKCLAKNSSEFITKYYKAQKGEEV